jgi:hypothetical protein
MGIDLKGGDLGVSEEKIQEAWRRLEEFIHGSRNITGPEALEALEREIRSGTDELARLMFEHRLQQALDSEEVKEAERQFIRALPGKLKNEGQEEVRICTGSGLRIRVRVSYYRRRCDRRNKKRSRGCLCGISAIRDPRALYAVIGLEGE